MPDSVLRQVWAVEQLRLSGGETVLEVGCGDGTAAARLCEAVGPEGHVLAVDRSAEAVAQARVTLAGWLEEGRAVLVHADLLHLGPATASVDHVLAVSVPPVWRSAYLTSEVWRVLRPGGSLHLVEHSPGWHHPADVDAGVRPVLGALAGYGFGTEPPTVQALGDGYAVHVRAVRPL
ncbi:class I SAM-dependent methyltransferase [Nocardioides marmoribigeumensis]|jgi:ubiquinone/menaquinone biosynthesis C-methylase UbiE|uniref:Ubiquinone/menaquinone biosynthesis C-methylase UbiE n=1 Tax=Nocardioides marmoribigeumensis TaxID=433649 RepID=A0ABU2BUF3_9ACTN|nr:class I SAM-dependent methyltransferase [Nocardioides marmoribigeumensis]MDR7362259.1 ubiquinone/menaquinone biosynthesis C-methylase UbiE [Nocardioides marmoribigeumensis]